ncbi:MAG: hypothetical protein ACOC00_00305 [Halothiobacillaceae bacterium]
MTESRRQQAGTEGFTESEAGELARGFDEQNEDRRGNFRPRPVLVQALGSFGAPNWGVLVGERAHEFTIASPRGLREGERVVIFDEEAPGGTRDIACIVTATRLANRPGDEQLKLVINYMVSEQTDPA